MVFDDSIDSIRLTNLLLNDDWLSVDAGGGDDVHVGAWTNGDGCDGDSEDRMLLVASEIGRVMHNSFVPVAGKTKLSCSS